VTLARDQFSRAPDLSGSALLVAIGSIIGVPVLVAAFPRQTAWLAMPLLVVTAAGVCLTVPDIERVTLVMAVVVLAAIVSLAAAIAPNRFLGSAIAFVIMGAAILDSGGRAAAIARAAGCFGVLLAAPVAGWLNELRRSAIKRHPPISLLVIVHCLVVGWSSRALIRETSVRRVVPAIAAALIGATILLIGASRPVAAET
jgi:hypothetical protein